MLDGTSTEVPFPRLETLARALLLLGRPEQAAPHLQRLEQAGFVPLYPFPAVGHSVTDHPAGRDDSEASAQATVRAPSSREHTPGSMPTR
jgi:hypothetical protein